MRFFLIVSVTSSFLIAGCNQQTKVSTPKDSIAVEHQHEEESKTIELNNGKKWSVDTEMMVHIRNMENDVKDYATKENQDYKLLAKKLQTHIELLTSNCTMKGKAHDELHKWLLPYIDLVDKFETAKDTTIAKKHFEEIQESFTVFNSYFK